MPACYGKLPGFEEAAVILTTSFLMLPLQYWYIDDERINSRFDWHAIRAIKSQMIKIRQFYTNVTREYNQVFISSVQFYKRGAAALIRSRSKFVEIMS